MLSSLIYHTLQPALALVLLKYTSLYMISFFLLFSLLSN